MVMKRRVRYEQMQNVSKRSLTITRMIPLCTESEYLQDFIIILKVYEN